MEPCSYEYFGIGGSTEEEEEELWQAYSWGWYLITIFLNHFLP